MSDGLDFILVSQVAWKLAEQIMARVHCLQLSLAVRHLAEVYIVPMKVHMDPIQWRSWNGSCNVVLWPQ